MKTQSIVLVLAGILVGCGAGATVAATWAGPTAGQWQCYDTTEFPDLNNAATSRARNVTMGIQQATPGAPAGTVVSISNNQGFFLCAKN